MRGLLELVLQWPDRGEEGADDGPGFRRWAGNPLFGDLSAHALHSGKQPEDPILASLQSAVQVRQAQLAVEKKVEVTNRITVEARALGQAALDVAEANYGYYSVLGSTRLLAPLFVGMLLSA